MVGDSFTPENSANPYQLARLPIIVTYVGGWLDIPACLLMSAKLSTASKF
ncbi:MAG: hypothetical protein ACPGSC_09185 [Granulosicoccaceae bacterium]